MVEVGCLTGYTGLYKLYRRFRGLDMCVCDVVLIGEVLPAYRV